MKIIKIPYHKVEIPILDVVTYMDVRTDPSGYVQFKTRTVKLQPREINGKIVNVAYDRETDTLYIQEKMK